MQRLMRTRAEAIHVGRQRRTGTIVNQLIASVNALPAQFTHLLRSNVSGRIASCPQKERGRAFSDFKHPAVLQQFGLRWEMQEDAFAAVPGIPPSAAFRDAMRTVGQLAAIVNTEKARSEWMIAPLLGDFWSRYHSQISLFSGVEFDADAAAKLNGFCDFLICRSPQRPDIQAPVLVLFEAKRENINDGLGQCIAAMVGTQRFNVRSGQAIDPVFGCITTGSAWKFLQLSGTTITFDTVEYQLRDADKLLGILTHIVGPVPAPIAAA